MASDVDDTVSADYPMIVPLEEHHQSRARELWMDRFGALEEHADKWLYDARVDVDTPTQGFVLKPSALTIAGFAIATIGDREYVENYIEVDVDFEPWERTGVHHILVVDDGFESQGVGTELVRHRLHWLDAMDVDGVVGISWHREDHHDSRPLFETFGFEAIEAVEEYYAVHDDAPCPDCEGACRCDATIYARSLADFGGDDGE